MYIQNVICILPSHIYTHTHYFVYTFSFFSGDGCQPFCARVSRTYTNNNDDDNKNNKHSTTTRVRETYIYIYIYIQLYLDMHTHKYTYKEGIYFHIYIDTRRSTDL